MKWYITLMLFKYIFESFRPIYNKQFIPVVLSFMIVILIFIGYLRDKFASTYYKGFMIKDPKYEREIDELFHQSSLIDDDECSENMFDTDGLSYDELEGYLKQLYNDSGMWKKFNKKNTREAISWVSIINKIATILICDQFIGIDPQCPEKRKESFYWMTRFVIEYEKIMKNSRFGLRPYADILISEHLKHVFFDGNIESLLLFADYYPAFVCDKIYPVINRDGIAYQDDFEQSSYRSIYEDAYQKYKKYI